MARTDTPISSLGELGDRTISKVKRRVLPLIVFLYFIAFLDRNNVGFAKLTMSEDIGLSATAYGLGAAEAGFFPAIILYLTYWVAPALYETRRQGWQSK